MDEVFSFLNQMRERLCDRPELVTLSFAKEGKYHEYTFEGEAKEIAFIVGEHGRTIKSLRSLAISIARKNRVGEIQVKIA